MVGLQDCILIFRKGRQVSGVIEIDGSHGEGGGQLVRLAVALAALTATPIAGS